MELTTPATEQLQSEVSPVKIQATTLVVQVADDVVIARDFIKTLKNHRAKIDATFDQHIRAAHKAHKDLVATKKTFTDSLDEAERIIKVKIATYQIEQERIAKEAAEKARLEFETEQKRLVENAQKRITATLNKADTVQEKIASLEYSLEHDRLDDTTRGMVERQIEVFRIQLQGLDDKAAEAQRKAEAAAEAPAFIPPAAVMEKTSGVSVKKTYAVTVTDPMALIKAIASGTGSPGLIKSWDETMIKKLALMGIFLLGVSYQEDRAISVR